MQKIIIIACFFISIFSTSYGQFFLELSFENYKTKATISQYSQGVEVYLVSKYDSIFMTQIELGKFKVPKIANKDANNYSLLILTSNNIYLLSFGEFYLNDNIRLVVTKNRRKWTGNYRFDNKPIQYSGRLRKFKKRRFRIMRTFP